MTTALLQGLDEMLIELIEKRNRLSALSYADADYDTVEDALHELEDDFQDEYGDYLADVLEAVHDEICPDDEVLFPAAYVAKTYISLGPDAMGKPQFEVTFPAGVPVSADENPDKDARLVFLPNPTRLVLMFSAKKKKVVWQAGKDNK